MREPLNLDREVLYFYQEGVAAVENGEVTCRKMRYVRFLYFLNFQFVYDL